MERERFGSMDEVSYTIIIVPKKVEESISAFE